MPRNRRRHHASSPPPPPSSGFSLVELLVVIGIIAALVGILIPVVGKMRNEGRKVDTAALINTIRSAAEAYHTNFKAYPGPFSDDDAYAGRVPAGISGGDPITGTEQLVLALCGGLKLDKNNRVNWSTNEYLDMSTNPPKLITPAGPMSMSPRNPKTYSPFLTDAAKFLPPDYINWGGDYKFRNELGTAKDTSVPEFVDRYPDPLPILYLRARKGAPGIIGDGSTPAYQYDLRQITGYTSMPALGGTHGLQKLGDVNKTIKDSMAENKGGADALAYFRIPGGTIPSGFGEKKQDGAAPRSADSYILISAGPDRRYGTYDDITSFGPVE